MHRPIVAVVGRPNVGKSTFFNKICGKRISIVDDTPGVTRDRLYADANWCGHDFLLVDTGGLDPKSEDVFQADIKKQAEIAMQESDVIVFLVDGKSGITSTDEEVASILMCLTELLLFFLKGCKRQMMIKRSRLPLLEDQMWENLHSSMLFLAKKGWW